MLVKKKRLLIMEVDGDNCHYNRFYEGFCYHAQNIGMQCKDEHCPLEPILPEEGDEDGNGSDRNRCTNYKRNHKSDSGPNKEKL